MGFVMTDMERTPTKVYIYGLHKSFGLMVLLLVVLRLGWKLMNPQPLLPESMRRIEKFAAHAGHWALYGLMFAMPLSGWLMTSAKGYPASMFGLFVLPDLIPADRELGHDLEEVHEMIAYAIIGMVSLHAAAAFLHHFVHKDNVLRRMLPGGKS